MFYKRNTKYVHMQSFYCIWSSLAFKDSWRTGKNLNNHDILYIYSLRVICLCLKGFTLDAFQFISVYSQSSD